MKHLLIITTLFILNLTVHAQDDFKKILSEHTFKIIEKHKEVPDSIFKNAGLIANTNMADPNQKCDLSCTPSKNIPTSKFNWAATDGVNWIISNTSGGFALTTNYRLVLNGNKVVRHIKVGTTTNYSFNVFKEKYISGAIEKDRIDYGNPNLNPE